MTTPKGIIDLLNGGRAGRGAALFELQKLKREGGSPALRQLCAELAQRTTPATTLPAHPEQFASRERYRRDQDEDLSPVELMWLQRLPLDPAEVTFEDATRLAALAGSISQMNAPASARLVASIWEPVKSLHDERVGRARVEAAKQPPPPIPQAAAEALREALAEEFPGLGEDAIATQTSNILDAFITERETRRQADIHAAEQMVSAAETARSQRQSTELEGADR